MLDSDVEITKQVEDAKFERDGTRTRFIRVEFHVGKHGPFVKRITMPDFEAGLRDSQVNTFAALVRTA